MMKIVIFLALFGTTWACSCYPMSPERKFCDADFVIRAKVLKYVPAPDGEQNFDAYYKINERVSIWKMADTNADTDMTKLYTGSASNLCGVGSLKRGKYLIAGNFAKNGERLQINSCTSLISSTRKPYKRWRRNPPNCNDDMETTTMANFWG